MWFLQFVFRFMSFRFWFLCVLLGWFLCVLLGVDFVFLDWFLHVYVLLGFDFCIVSFVWVMISRFSSFASNLKLPNGSDPLNRWPKLLASTWTYGRLWVHFMFTRANWVGYGLTQNPIQPDSWTTLDGKIICTELLLNQMCQCMDFKMCGSWDINL